MYVYDLSTKTVKSKTWSHLPGCTSVFRWLEHYYCFHGHNFTRFQPVTGEVTGSYPKDARHYFMHCPNFGESFNKSDCRILRKLAKPSGRGRAQSCVVFIVEWHWKWQYIAMLTKLGPSHLSCHHNLHWCCP